MRQQFNVVVRVRVCALWYSTRVPGHSYMNCKIASGILKKCEYRFESEIKSTRSSHGCKPFLEPNISYITIISSFQVLCVLRESGSRSKVHV